MNLSSNILSIQSAAKSDNCKGLKVFKMYRNDKDFTKDDWKCLLEINGLQMYIGRWYPYIYLW